MEWNEKPTCLMTLLFGRQRSALASNLFINAVEQGHQHHNDQNQGHSAVMLQVVVHGFSRYLAPSMKSNLFAATSVLSAAKVLMRLRAAMPPRRCEAEVRAESGTPERPACEDHTPGSAS